jgi:hypothetical protein
MWSIFVFVLALIIAIMLDIPIWLYLILVVPLLIILFTIGSFSYSFRKSLQIEPVPKSGYKKRIAEMNTDARMLAHRGFNKLDESYLKMIPDAVIFVFKHRDEPIYLCLYHLGTKKHATSLPGMITAIRLRHVILLTAE